MADLKGLLVVDGRTDDELSFVGHGTAAALRIANKPLIHYGLEALRDCGIDEIGVVVPRAGLDDMLECVGDGARLGLRVSYFERPAGGGLAGALLAARGFLGSSPFVVHPGCSLALAPLAPLAHEFERSGAPAMLLLRGPDGGGDGGGEGDPDGGRRHLRSVTRQTVPHSGELSGIAFFSEAPLEAAAALAHEPGESGVAEIAAWLAATGSVPETRSIGAWTYSGTVDAVLDLNRMVLDERLATDVAGVDLSSARIEGRVRIHPSATLDRTTLRGPLTVGRDAVLVDTFVGPYTSIGEGVCVEGAEIEHSIVLDRASIRHPGKRIEASLVGHGATVCRDFALPGALRLRVGRGAEVSLG